ncbi:MAG: trypsin-like peptidase domain-containing protein [Thermoguttaceae bacterium]
MRRVVTHSCWSKIRKKWSVYLGITTYFALSFLPTFILADSGLDEKHLTRSSARLTPTIIALEKARQAVVNIQGDRIETQNGTDPNEIGKAYNGMGTGVIIDSRGYIVTNFHVIDGIRRIQITTADGSGYTANLVGRDPLTDLAVIKINGDGPFSAMKLGRSSEVIWGEKVYAIGNPLGYEFTLTDGIVSSLGRNVPVNSNLTYPNAIQTNTGINPGNSGGPLLNVDGEMIGMNSAIRQDASGIAFALPVDYIVAVSSKLIQQRVNTTCYYGMQVKTNETTGELLVESVDRGSPAEQAGINVGDVIQMSESCEIQNSLDFLRTVLERKPNERVQMSLLRSGEPVQVTMQLGKPRNGNFNANQGIAANGKKGQTATENGTNAQNAQSAKNATNARNGQSATTAPNSGVPEKQTVPPASRYGTQVQRSTGEEKGSDDTWNYLGIQCAAIPQDTYERQFESYLSYYPDGAVLVRSVRSESPLAQAGIEKGDVIFGIHDIHSETDGWATATEEDLEAITETLRRNRKAKTLKIWLCGSRNGGPQTYYEASCQIP